ncbi:MAG: T9SS type A sorting domain-containing protein, partial [Bacteroidales bacterium]|nr:T9SS type A sorting domain-containing protein [Bacteroidales bacterium]
WSNVVSFETHSEGIDDVAAAAISLYPNPASSTVTLMGIEGMATVTVVDMNGRETGKWTVSDGELTIDVTDMAQGAYFVRIVGEQVNAIRKLIVR